MKIFSKENRKALEEIIDVTGDEQIRDYLKSEETIDEDKILDEIIHTGKNVEVDRVIDLLQFQLKKSGCMWHNACGEEGMILSRGSFACMIKVMGLGDDFLAMVDSISVQADMQDGEDAAEIQNNLLGELKTC